MELVQLEERLRALEERVMNLEDTVKHTRGGKTMKFDEMDREIAECIHYPGCWDTVAYPTLASALWELIAWGPMGYGACPTCGKPQGPTTRGRRNDE